MKAVRFSTFGLFVIGWVAAPSPGAAAETNGSAENEREVGGALAEALYQKGRELMAAKDYAAACPKFAESQRLDPATGTLLNLAACHEAEGRLASAWLEFTSAEQAARLDGRADRVLFAQEHVAALATRVPSIRFRVSNTQSSLLELRLDGIVIAVTARDVETPLDPGLHEIQASAPGTRPWSTKLQVVEAQKVVVEVPELALLDTESSPVRVEIQAQALPVTAPPPASSSPTVADIRRTDPSGPASSVPAEVWVLGGSALALGAATGLTGVVYLNRRADYRQARSNQEEYAALNRKYNGAQDMLTVNTVLASATLALSGLAIYYAVRQSSYSPALVRVSASAGPFGTALFLSGNY